MIMNSPNETAPSVHHFRRSSAKIASPMSLTNDVTASGSAYAWTPTPEQLEHANVTRLARRLGCGDYHALHRLSVEEPERFWRAVADDLGLALARPWERV